MMDDEDTLERRLLRARANARANALQRAALELWIAGWTYAQIAAAFGVSEHEASTMVERARKQWFERLVWRSQQLILRAHYRQLSERDTKEEVEDTRTKEQVEDE